LENFIHCYIKKWRKEMTKTPMYLGYKQVPDVDLLTKIKVMTKDGMSPKKMKEELPEISLYTITRYYTKIRRCIW
jgi:hypothetical protein